jgi:hypothetical protein
MKKEKKAKILKDNSMQNLLELQIEDNALNFVLGRNSKYTSGQASSTHEGFKKITSRNKLSGMEKFYSAQGHHHENQENSRKKLRKILDKPKKPQDEEIRLPEIKSRSRNHSEEPAEKPNLQRPRSEVKLFNQINKSMLEGKASNPVYTDEKIFRLLNKLKLKGNSVKKLLHIKKQSSKERRRLISINDDPVPSWRGMKKALRREVGDSHDNNNNKSYDKEMRFRRDEDEVELTNNIEESQRFLPRLQERHSKKKKGTSQNSIHKLPQGLKPHDAPHKYNSRNGSQLSDCIFPQFKIVNQNVTMFQSMSSPREYSESHQSHNYPSILNPPHYHSSNPINSKPDPTFNHKFSTNNQVFLIYFKFYFSDRLKLRNGKKWFVKARNS